jgi:hypothetical protein
MNQDAEGNSLNELAALRQRLEELEAEHQNLQRQVSRRPFFSRKFVPSALVGTLVMVAVAVLWGQEVISIFVDPKGNVGIGTKQPQAKLDVSGGATFSSVGINHAPLQGQTLLVVPKSEDIPLNVTNPANTVNWLTVLKDGQVLMKGGDVTIANKLSAGELSVGGKVTAKGLYVTGDLGEAASGVEFRHTNETQGIGFGFNSIYATGSNANQPLNLMPRGTSGVGIGTINPQAKLDVKGEIRGKLWYSGPYNWSKDQPATKMTRSDRTVCFLTRVTGYFYGGGERVEIVDNGGYWYLQGAAQTRDVAATARCVGAPDDSW